MRRRDIIQNEMSKPDDKPEGLLNKKQKKELYNFHKIVRKIKIDNFTFELHSLSQKELAYATENGLDLGNMSVMYELRIRILSNTIKKINDIPLLEYWEERNIHLDNQTKRKEVVEKLQADIVSRLFAAYEDIQREVDERAYPSNDMANVWGVTLAEVRRADMRQLESVAKEFAGREA